ncbi:hypothetical protein VPH35_099365 [Triticum aestivum]|uniref:Uncharacterized protein n=4 Tax=Aegilops tauschii subsp. strangulata TaxID=200361 RepID=A0A453LJM1_AEGTS
MHLFNLNIYTDQRWLLSKFVESYYRWAVPMDRHGMVPDHSFLQAISSCLVAILLDKFYDMVDQGSIVLKKAKSFSFCKQGVIVEGESTPIYKERCGHIRHRIQSRPKAQGDVHIILAQRHCDWPAIQ